MLSWLHKLLGGASPVTGYIGSLGIITSGLTLIQDAIATEGLPNNKLEWVILLLSIGVRMAKDANRSNAPTPVQEAVKVK